jgi:ferredoxin-type protein NapG/ferredoxin-type protein NapH
MERRSFIKMVFGGGILGFLMRAGKAVSADEGLIRPPGAEPEEIFLGTCARCGKCAEICPRGCIKIAHGEQGAAIGTPYIVPVENYCDLCMKCVEVCTAGALKPVEKEKVRMGLAQIDKDICLARKGEDCRVCHAACPFYDKAIKLEDYKYPTVDPDYCTGCGRCENVCIASPQKAATVKPRQD